MKEKLKFVFGTDFLGASYRCQIGKCLYLIIPYAGRSFEQFKAQALYMETETSIKNLAPYELFNTREEAEAHLQRIADHYTN